MSVADPVFNLTSCISQVILSISRGSSGIMNETIELSTNPNCGQIDANVRGRVLDEMH